MEKGIENHEYNLRQFIDIATRWSIDSLYNSRTEWSKFPIVDFHVMEARRYFETFKITLLKELSTLTSWQAFEIDLKSRFLPMIKIYGEWYASNKEATKKFEPYNFYEMMFEIMVSTVQEIEKYFTVPTENENEGMFVIDKKKIRIKDITTGSITDYNVVGEYSLSHPHNLANKNIYDLHGNLLKVADNPKDYDLDFALKLKKIYPIYEVEKLLDYHFNHASDKQQFLKHIKYHILLFPFLKNEQPDKCTIINEWLFKQSAVQSEPMISKAELKEPIPMNDLELISKQENLFWKGLPMEDVVNHFKVFSLQKSKNGKPYLTEQQLVMFLRKGFLKEDLPKQKINFGNGEKGKVILRFYELFNYAVVSYNEKNDKAKYIDLVENCFENMGERSSITSFFKPDMTKQTW